MIFLSPAMMPASSPMMKPTLRSVMVPAEVAYRVHGPPCLASNGSSSPFRKSTRRRFPSGCKNPVRAGTDGYKRPGKGPLMSATCSQVTNRCPLKSFAGHYKQEHPPPSSVSYSTVKTLPGMLWLLVIPACSSSVEIDLVGGAPD